MARNDKPKPVLSDHRKVGKRFIPPMADLHFPLRETSWAKVTMPELLWIACLNDSLGPARAATVAVAVSKAALEQHPKSKTWFASISSYAQLDREAQEAVVERVKSEHMLEEVGTSLCALQHFYPRCPFSSFYPDSEPQMSDSMSALASLKNLVARLYDKTTREAMLVQGTAVYLGVTNDRVKFASGSIFKNFPELEKYPDTEISRMVASGVRAMMPMVVQAPDEPYSTEWARYFWNRGLEIDQCKTTT